MKNIFLKSNTADSVVNTCLDAIKIKNFYARERETSADQPMKTQQLTQSIASVFFLAACFVAITLAAQAGPPPAANITWGSAQNITGDSDVSTLGSLLYAYNIGGPGVSSASVNGVTFSPYVFEGNKTTTTGSVTFTETPGSLVRNNNMVAGSGDFAALSADYQTLLSSAGGGDKQSTLTGTFGGLTIGNDYLIQWWFNRSSSVSDYFDRTEASQLGGNSTVTLDSNVSNSVGGLGQYAIGTFTATSPSVAFNLNGVGASWPWINAFQLRASSNPTLYWLGSNGTLWTASNNWSSNATGTPTENFASDSDIVFSATGSSNETATNLGGDQTIASLTINTTSAVGISGGNLTIDGTSAQAITVEAGDLTIASPLALAGSATTITANQSTTIDSITASSGLVLDGTSTTRINNRVWVSELGGSLDIQSGTFELGDGLSSGVGASNETITVNGTGTINATTTINVGYDGDNNSLSATSGGSVSAPAIWIGGLAGADNNSVTVDGTGTSLVSTSSTAVGYAGSNNTLTISNGATSGGTSAPIYIGLESTANNNTATVTGANSTLSTTGAFIIGNNGTANALAVANGGRVLTTGQDFQIGFNAGSNNNALTVNGTGSLVTNNATLYLGNNGANNTLTVSNGGNLTTRNGRIGTNAASTNNTATITGAGSVWNNTGTLRVGNAGSNNTLAIADGGLARITGNTFLGHGAASAGNNITVNGNGSTLQAGNLTVGNDGSSNTLSISSGGNATLAGSLAIGFNAASANNTATVSGAGSTLTAQNIQIGAGANNKLVVADSGLVTTANIALSGTNATLQIGDGGAAGNLSLSGTILTTGSASGRSVVFNHTDSAYEFSSTLSGDLALAQNGNGTTALTANNTYTGGTTISAGTLSIGNGGTSGSISGNITNNAALAFNRSDDITFTDTISGTGTLEKLGAGTLTLSSGNHTAGDTTINAGGLVLSAASTLTTTGAVAANTGTLTIGQGGSLAVRSTTIIQNTPSLFVANGGSRNISVFALQNNQLLARIPVDGFTLSGLAIDGSGNIYVSATDSSTISKFSSNGTFLSSISGNMSSPCGVAIDGNGNIYAANSQQSTISKFSSDGTFLNTITGNLSGADGLAIDASGNLYATSVFTSTIDKFSSDGTFLNTISGNMTMPRGLAIDGNGNIYAANNGSNTISKFSSDGTFLNTISGDMHEPIGLAIDESGKIYVSNAFFLGFPTPKNSNTISVFSSNQTFLNTISGNMTYPQGLAIGNYTQEITPINGVTLAASSNDTATLNLGTYGGSDTTATLDAPFIRFGNGRDEPQSRRQYDRLCRPPRRHRE
jgi:T5SS/PEP-CTERM-associated repeat protein